MRTQSSPIHAVIHKGRTLRLNDGAGFTLRVLEGRAWLAEERSAGDRVLDAGDAAQIDCLGLVLVYAFTEARVEIAPSGEAPAPAMEIGGDHRHIMWMIFYATLAGAARAMADRSRMALRRLRGLQPPARWFSRS